MKDEHTIEQEKTTEHKTRVGVQPFVMSFIPIVICRCIHCSRVKEVEIVNWIAKARKYFESCEFSDLIEMFNWDAINKRLDGTGYQFRIIDRKGKEKS